MSKGASHVVEAPWAGGGLWPVDEELECVLIEFAVCVDADVGFFGIIFGAHASAFPDLCQSEFFQDAEGCGVVGGHACGQRE